VLNNKQLFIDAGRVVLYLGYANLIAPRAAASQHALANECPLLTHCAVCFADKPPLPVARNIWRSADLEVADLRDHFTRKADAVGTLRRSVAAESCLRVGAESVATSLRRCSLREQRGLRA
jgi:hypothetical protein